jgi:hypothetical protein
LAALSVFCQQTLSQKPCDHDEKLTSVGNRAWQGNKCCGAIDEDNLAQLGTRNWVISRFRVILCPDVEHRFRSVCRGVIVVPHAIIECFGGDIYKESILRMISACCTIQDICNSRLCPECFIDLATESDLVIYCAFDFSHFA